MHFLLTFILLPQGHSDIARGVFDVGDVEDNFAASVFLTVLHNLQADTEILLLIEEAPADVTTRREGSLDVEDFVVGDVDDGIGVFAHVGISFSCCWYRAVCLYYSITGILKK